MTEPRKRYKIEWGASPLTVWLAVIAVFVVVYAIAGIAYSG